MTTQSSNTTIRVAAGISLAALLTLTQASAGSDSGRLEAHSKSSLTPTETATQEIGCSESYPTLAAGYFAMLQSQYGTQREKTGGEGRTVAKRLPPCPWLPASRPITPTQWQPGFTRRTRTRHTYSLGNEMGLRRWGLYQGYPSQGFGRIPRGGIPSWSVETEETESYGLSVPR